MPRVFAIGDIHGCSATFQKLLFQEIQIEKSDTIYCLGDFVDRGRNSKEVIDTILDLRKEGYTIHALRGNHEQMMLDAYKGNDYVLQWYKNGGEITLKSFGIFKIEDLPNVYLDFLNDTQFYIETDDFVFVHAGLNFELENPFLDFKAMLWSRDDYFDRKKINFKKVIHGHTPSSIEKILNPVNPYNINIDGGCVKNHKPRYGNLIGLSLPEMRFIIVENIDG